MTRAEVHALGLALSVLRRRRWGGFMHAIDVLRIVPGVPGDIGRAASAAFLHDAMVGERLLRARLGLLLRWLLRAEVDEFGTIEHGRRGASFDVTGAWERHDGYWPHRFPIVCSECGEHAPTWDDGDTLANPCPVTKQTAHARLARPLWVAARMERER